jgi:hypothetical protein
MQRTSLHDVELIVKQGQVKAQELASKNYSVIRDTVFGKSFTPQAQ